MTGQILLTWLKMLALHGDLAKDQPKTLRYRILHAAARGGGPERLLAHTPGAEADLEAEL